MVVPPTALALKASPMHPIFSPPEEIWGRGGGGGKVCIFFSWSTSLLVVGSVSSPPPRAPPPPPCPDPFQSPSPILARPFCCLCLVSPDIPSNLLHACLCMYVCAHVCVYVCVCACMRVHAPVYVCVSLLLLVLGLS